MKRLTFLTTFLLISTICIAQKDSSSINLEPKNFIGFDPSDHKSINGLILDFFIATYPSDYTDQSFNGLHASLNPLEIFISGWAFFYIGLTPIYFITHPKNSYTLKSANSKPDTTFINPFEDSHKINGISVYPFGWGIAESSNNNGFVVSTVVLQSWKNNGLCIVGLLNDSYKISGVTITGISNNSKVTKGAQISLFNSTEELSGIQIGLLNKVGKRIIPFINVGFGKRKNKNRNG